MGLRTAALRRIRRLTIPEKSWGGAQAPGVDHPDALRQAETDAEREACAAGAAPATQEGASR